MIIVSPSILSADFANLETDFRTVDNAQFLHIDVMDGHFVPNITIGIPVLKSIHKVSNKILDVHLMISDPIKYVAKFCDEGADIVTVHYESCDYESLLSCIDIIHSKGKKAGVTIKPATDVTVLDPLLDLVDMILIMTVEPGFGGQKFMSNMVDKISYIRSKSDIDIEVDGGINLETAQICVNAGANILVAGNYIFNSDNRKETINGLLSIKS